jgi:hypothetical protein
MKAGHCAAEAQALFSRKPLAWMIRPGDLIKICNFLNLGMEI